MTQLCVALTLCCAALGAQAGFWKSTSTQPVVPLGHPTPDERVATLGDRLEGGFQFVAYGDQRALADGEWQAMVGRIAELAAEPSEQPILFVLDTGDIVQDGRHTDQFHQLRELLAPLRELPYLVALGNHEVHNDDAPIAREHAAAALRGSITPDFPSGSEALHWEWSYGPLRLLAIDSNQLIYRREDESSEQHDRRVAAELDWLRARLAEPEGDRHTILSLHHPLVQSSSKHRDSAIELWETEFAGKRLLDLFADGGVDIVLTGHTHTYETFRLTRADGHVIWQVNLSGRPRGDFLGFGGWLRRATDIRGRERQWLERKGFRQFEGWEVEQVDVMAGRERNQFAVFRVGVTGEVGMRVCYVGKKEPFGVEEGEALSLVGSPGP